MSEQAAERRLATIVSIDVAGYSARAEADEDSAVDDVKALAARITEACDRHGGRVFNTAGDGFMLEFHTVTGALEAAGELAWAPEAPAIRVGVHLGEVRVMENGDLLGHGVNVAARIQGRAPAGAVLVSADVRRAVRGALAERLAPKGQVKLDKMNETIAVFALAPAAGRSAPAARGFNWRRARGPAAIAVVLLVLAAGGVFAWPRLAHSAPPRVAVLPFEVAGDDTAAQALASGLTEEIAGVLTANRVLTVSPSQTAGLRGPDRDRAAGRLDAAFILDGSVSKDGDTLKVNIRIDDTRDHLTLWSQTFSEPAAMASVLQTEVAAKTTDLLGFAVTARREAGSALDGASLADFVNGNERMVFGGIPAGQVAARPFLLRVVAQAPKFSRGHSTLAGADAGVAREVGSDSSALRAEATAEIRKAIALDPKNPEPYLAIANLAAGQSWSETEGAFLKGVAVDPDFAYLDNTYSYLLARTGRLRDAAAMAERGLAANALHPGANYKYALTLLEGGRALDAREAIEKTARLWPQAWVNRARLMIVMVQSPPEEAQAVLDQAIAHPFAGGEQVLPIWKAYLQALRSRDAGLTAKASRAIGDGYASGVMEQQQAVLALGRLGDADGAYAVAQHDLKKLAVDNADVFFAPQTAPLRADPRFWPLMARLGLVQYWKASGRWPDFCSDPAAQCRARASDAAAKEPHPIMTS